MFSWQHLLGDAECFSDLGKLNFQMVGWFKLEPIYATAPAASKNTALFNSGQNRLENNRLASLILIGDTLCRTNA